VYVTQTTQTLDPRWVAQVTDGRAGPEAAPARDLSWDTRRLSPGDAFVALPGERTHGNRFLGEAFARGAAFALTDQDHPRAVRVADPYRALVGLGRALRLRFPGAVIGVTGSVGKTSTKEAIAQGLGLPATEGNLNTPPALARFFLHLDAGAPAAVVELGIDRPGEMDDLIELAAPQVGVLTAVAPAHLEALGSLEAVAREKAKLIAASELGLAEHGAARAAGLGEVLTYGFTPEARFPGEDLRLEADAVRFRYRGLEVVVPHPGRPAALAALAAMAVAEALGRDLAEVRDRLAGLKLPAGRMERLRLRGALVINDAYNANPASVAAGLEALARIPGRRLVVLGEMLELGDESLRHHLQAARQAAEVADELFFLGRFAEEMARAAGRGRAYRELDRLARDLKAELGEGDVLYLKASRAVALERILEELGEG